MLGRMSPGASLTSFFEIMGLEVIIWDVGEGREEEEMMSDGSILTGPSKSISSCWVGCHKVWSRGLCPPTTATSQHDLVASGEEVIVFWAKN